MLGFTSVVLLDKTHEVARFECGKPSLDRWLKQFALQNQRADATRVYVACLEGTNRIIGYYAIKPGQLSVEESTERTRKGLGQYPIGVAVLAHLAADVSVQGGGLGKALLKHALLRINAAIEILGGRAVVVHALDEDARNFYEKYGFESSPMDSMTMMLLVKDMRASLKQSDDPEANKQS